MYARCLTDIFEDITILKGEILNIVAIEGSYLLLRYDKEEESYHIMLSIFDKRIEVQWET